MPLLMLLAKPAVLFALLLALSVGANAILWKAWKGQLKEIGAAQAKTRIATDAAQACSDGVKKLREAADARSRETAETIAAADRLAREADRLALLTLQERPTVAGDACASAAALSRRKLMERRR